ncbi:MAG: hypothetical protein FRX49_06201 [Trebouxia sp. A1-2]|nr:MAG: hypothetical protein FRX49_06201 [Trebouxia sp. A1-2]
MRASANRWGSSSGTKAAVCAVLLPGSNHTLISAPSDDLAIVGNSLSLLQIFPAAAPTAFSLAAVQAAAGRPGKAAVQIRRQGAETVCRLLGGDLTLVDEIQRRHAQVAGTAEEEFLLANTQAGSTQQAVSHKRCLDDDDEDAREYLAEMATITPVGHCLNDITHRPFLGGLVNPDAISEVGSSDTHVCCSL